MHGLQNCGLPDLCQPSVSCLAGKVGTGARPAGLPLPAVHYPLCFHSFSLPVCPRIPGLRFLWILSICGTWRVDF